jgi:hypothetical protein
MRRLNSEIAKCLDGVHDRHLISVFGAGGTNDNLALVEANMPHKQLRAQLGNDIAIRTFLEGKLPFPDGTIIAARHWNEVPPDEACLQSSVPESAVNVAANVMEPAQTLMASTFLSARINTGTSWS